MMSKFYIHSVSILKLLCSIRDQNAIYARPSRKNKRIKVTANGNNRNPVQMQACPAYPVDSNGKESNYSIPRKSSGSIDSVDLHLYHSEAKDTIKPLPSTPRAPYTPPLPPAHPPNGFYPTLSKQARSMDNLSSYAQDPPITTERNDSLYQAPRYPSLSVDDLLNGIPTQRFHRTFSPLHAATRSPGAIPRIPKDTYDDPRTPTKRVIAVSNSTYDAPRSYVQPGSKPLPINDAGSSPLSMPRTPMDAYDDPRKPSTTVTVGNAMYDTPRHTCDHQQSGSPTKHNDVFESPTRTPEDAYDDPRKPSITVGNSTYDSPRNPYKYTQIDTPQKPALADDEDDPDYSYVE